jgi:hypothetical protein
MRYLRKLAVWGPGLAAALLLARTLYYQVMMRPLCIELHRAVNRQDAAKVEALLARGVDPNCEITIHEVQGNEVKAHTFPIPLWTMARPPLIGAVREGNQRIVKALCRHHAAIDARDSDGTTALMDAAWADHPAIVRLLLGNGANPNLRDRYKQTALGYVRDPDGAGREIAKLIRDAVAARRDRD